MDQMPSGLGTAPQVVTMCTACALAGARLLFQVMHYKAKELKDSLLAWATLDTDTLFPRHVVKVKHAPSQGS